MAADEAGNEQATSPISTPEDDPTTELLSDPTSEAAVADSEADDPRETPEGPTTDGEGEPSEAAPDLAENLTKLQDGSYRYTVDPEDPHSTVYTGRTERELWENVTKGIRAKDTYIQQIKAERAAPKFLQELKRDPGQARAAAEQPEADQVEFADEAKILEKTARARGVDPAMLKWTDEEWRNYELDNGGLLTFRKAQLVDEVRRAATAEYNQKNAQAVNHLNLLREMKLVPEICAAKHVDVDDIDWDQLFAKIQADPKKYYLDNGLLAPGVFIHEAHLAIDRLKATRSKETLIKTAEATIAAKRAEKSKAAATSAGGSHREVKSVSQKAYDSLDTLTEDLKQMARKGLLD